MPISKMLLQCQREAAKSQLTFERTEAKLDKNGISRKGSQGQETEKDLKWNKFSIKENMGSGSVRIQSQKHREAALTWSLIQSHKA